MSEQSSSSAAVEAAQNVVDSVASWDYSSEERTVEESLDSGLAEAGVRLDEQERRRVLEELAALKEDETAGTPTVRAAEPVEQG